MLKQKGYAGGGTTLSFAPIQKVYADTKALFEGHAVEDTLKGCTAPHILAVYRLLSVVAHKEAGFKTLSDILDFKGESGVPFRETPAGKSIQ